jgi:hypothetical protein
MRRLLALSVFITWAGLALGQSNPETILGKSGPDVCPVTPPTAGWGPHCVPGYAAWESLFKAKQDLVVRPGAAAVATTAGVLGSGDCVSIDVYGNLVDAGGACTTGGATVIGTGAITPATLADRTTNFGAVFDVEADFGAVCDGVTDDAAAINAALQKASLQSGVLRHGLVKIPRGKLCRASTTIVVPYYLTLDLGGYNPQTGVSPDPGGGIVCDAGVSPCVSLGVSNANAPTELVNGTVSHAGSTPAASVVNVMVYGYAATIRDVLSDNAGICYKFYAHVGGAAGGIHAEVWNSSSERCSDAYIDVVNWPELYWFGGRQGAAYDYAANTYVRVENPNAAGAGAANTVTFNTVQFNSGAATGPLHFWEWENYTTGTFDAGNYHVIGGHVEDLATSGGGVFYSDSTVTDIPIFTMTNTTINAPSTPLFALNSATSVHQWDLTAIHAETAASTLAPASGGTISQFKITGGLFLNPLTLTSNDSSVNARASVVGTDFASGPLTVSGTWAQFDATGITGSCPVNNISGSTPGVFDNDNCGRNTLSIAPGSGDAKVYMTPASGTNAASIYFRGDTTTSHYNWQLASSGGYGTGSHMSFLDGYNAFTAALTLNEGGNITLGETAANTLTVNGGLALAGGPVKYSNLSCNGALTGSTDIATALNADLAAFATSSGGAGTYYLSAPTGCLAASAQIVVPSGITLACAQNLQAIQPFQVSAYGTRACELGGSTTASAAVVLRPSAAIQLEVINPNLSPSLLTGTTRQQLQQLALFAGTGVLAPADSVPAVGGQNAQIINTSILGFAQCADFETIHPSMQHVRGDCTNGATFEYVHDVGSIHDVQFEPYLTQNSTNQTTTYSISGIQNGGSNAVQVILPSGSDVQVGDVVFVSGTGGRPDLVDRWTISAVSSCSGSVCATLSGAHYGAFTATGNTIGVGDTTGARYFLTGLVGLPGRACSTTAACYTVTDSASSLPGGTSISWFDATSGSAQINAQALTTQTGDTFTLTPGTYTSGGTLQVTSLLRHGTAFNFGGVGDDQLLYLSDVFVLYYDVAFHMGNQSTWITVNNCGVDFPFFTDWESVAIKIDGYSFGHIFSNCTIQALGVGISSNSTYVNAADAVLMMRGSNWIGAAKLGEFYQGIHNLDAGWVAAGPVLVSNYGANFTNSATITSGVTTSFTLPSTPPAWATALSNGVSVRDTTTGLVVGTSASVVGTTVTLKSTAASTVAIGDVLNLYSTTTVNNAGQIPYVGIEYAGVQSFGAINTLTTGRFTSLGIGPNEDSPVNPVEINTGGGDTAVGLSVTGVNPISGNSDAQMQISPTGIIMHRHPGGSATMSVGTSATSWGSGIAAGQTCWSPQGVYGECWYADGLVYPSKQLSIATLLAISCTSAVRGARAFVHDTLANAAPAWNGTVTAGGSTTVNNWAHCDDSTSAWRWGN